MQSILTACFAPDTKKPQDWFRNQSTQELLSEAQRDILFSENSEEQRVGKKPQSPKLYENREKLPNGLRGYYVHRLLVNAVAMWASPLHLKYIFIEFSTKIMNFLKIEKIKLVLFLFIFLFCM